MSSDAVSFNPSAGNPSNLPEARNLSCYKFGMSNRADTNRALFLGEQEIAIVGTISLNDAREPRLKVILEDGRSFDIKKGGLFMGWRVLSVGGDSFELLCPKSFVGANSSSSQNYSPEKIKELMLALEEKYSFTKEPDNKHDIEKPLQVTDYLDPQTNFLFASATLDEDGNVEEGVLKEDTESATVYDGVESRRTIPAGTTVNFGKDDNGNPDPFNKDPEPSFRDRQSGISFN